MSELRNALVYFLAAAVFQNLVLTTGIGSALTLRLTRNPSNRKVFFLALLGFSLVTVVSFYPIDRVLGLGELGKLFRPVVLVALCAIWYLVAALLLKKLLPRVYQDIRSMLPYAAVNTVVTGVGLIANHQFQSSLLVCMALAVGATVGFILVFLVLAEGIDRMQHEEMPKAFAGLPAQFLYLGILALALCGFATDISFI